MSKKEEQATLLKSAVELLEHNVFVLNNELKQKENVKFYIKKFLKNNKK